MQAEKGVKSLLILEVRTLEEKYYLILWVISADIFSRTRNKKADACLGAALGAQKMPGSLL